MILGLVLKLIEVVEQSLVFLIASKTFRSLVINSMSCITLRSLVFHLSYLKFDNL